MSDRPVDGAANRCDCCARAFMDWDEPTDVLWALVVPEGGFLCPECFIRRAFEEHGLDGWRIEVRRGD